MHGFPAICVDLGFPLSVWKKKVFAYSSAVFLPGILIFELFSQFFDS